MKLTKAKLRQIIKEEIGASDPASGVNAAHAHLVNSVDSLIRVTLEEDEFVLPDIIREKITKKISDMIFEMLSIISRNDV